MALAERDHTLGTLGTLDTFDTFDVVEDWAEGERRDRAILQHMVLSLLAGMLLGGVGALMGPGPGPFHALYTPYAHVLLAVVIGRTAAGLGWAVLAGMLAAFGSLLSVLVATAVDPGGWSLGFGAGVPMNLAIAALVTVGVLSHLSKRPGYPGVLAAGGVAGMVLLQGLAKAIPGDPGHVQGFWPWGVVVVTALAAGMLVSPVHGSDRVRSAPAFLRLLLPRPFRALKRRMADKRLAGLDSL